MKEPDWEKLVIQWDAFASRHWPGVRRETDWRKAKWKFKSSAPIFTLHYVAKKQEVELNSVSLSVRLTDGKIGGIYALDFAPNLPKTSIPPIPSREQILASVKRALPRFKHWHRNFEIKTLRITEMRRGYSRLGMGNQVVFKQNRFGFNVDVTLIGRTSTGRTVKILAQYDEQKQQADITGYGYTDELGEDATGEPIAQKPLTSAAERTPRWSSKADGLWFNSTRDVEGRPWWQRDSVLLSIGYRPVANEGAVDFRFIRPIKPLNYDFRGYESPIPSPNEKYLAATQGSGSNKLFFLDLQSGQLYFPEPDARAKAAARIISPQEENPPLRLEIAGADWLPDEHGLILSLTNKDRDPNLYVARWQKNAPPRDIELIPIVLELGTDVLPRLGRDGKTLAWARKIYKRERDKKPGEKDQWQLLVADFTPDNLVTRAPEPKPGEIVYALEAIAKLNTRNRRTLELPEEPLSIAWDNPRSRWLVVTRSKVLWVREVEGQLQSEVAPDLKWNGIVLRPTSADVSRDGKIAIAAELATPQVYPKTECVVRSLIFGWDGQSTSVLPLYEPSLNGIARYVFPATKSTWARIEGDAKRLGLEGLADPASFVSSTSAAP